MAYFTRLAALAALLASSASIVGAVAASGSGTTTRYWYDPFLGTKNSIDI